MPHCPDHPFSVRRPLTTPLARALTVALALPLLAACASAARLTPSGQDEYEDSATRAAYYEEAAKTYYDGGRYQSAVDMWDKVLIERPDDQWAKFGIAKALHMMATPESLRRAQFILEGDPKQGYRNGLVRMDWTHPTRGSVLYEVQTTLASVYSDRADFYDRDARSIQTRLENDPNADARELEGQLRQQEGRRDELLRKSIPVWQRVLAQSPTPTAENEIRDNPFALAGLAKANLVAGDQVAGINYAERYIAISEQSYERWVEHLQEWRRISQGSVTPEQQRFFMDRIAGSRNKQMQMHLLLGSVEMRRENFNKAIDHYDAVVELDPAMPAAYVERAQAYAAMTLYPQAVADLEQYLKMTDPEKHRGARVNAAELLDRYRRLAATTGGAPGYPARVPTSSGPTSSRTGPSRSTPPPGTMPQPMPQPRQAPPAPRPSDRAHGSPDG